LKLGCSCTGAPKTFYVSSGIKTGGLQWQYIINCHIFSNINSDSTIMIKLAVFEVLLQMGRLNCLLFCLVVFSQVKVKVRHSALGDRITVHVLYLMLMLCLNILS